MTIGSNIYINEQTSQWMKIQPIPYYRGFDLNLALISSQFEYISNFKKKINEHKKEDPLYCSRDEELYEPKYNFDFFFIYILENESIKKGIINRKGDILAFDNFDEAILFPKSFIVLKKANKYGFINGMTSTSTKIEYKKLDFSPLRLFDYQLDIHKFAVIACIEFGWEDCYGVLDCEGNTIVPLIYDEVKISRSSLYVRIKEQEADIKLNQINPDKQIELHPCRIKNRFPHVEDFDDGEMAYIRNNGGDWIDD